MNYTEQSIKTLENLEPVRKNASMYLNCSVDKPESQFQIIKEILDNCVDEAGVTDRVSPIDIYFLTSNKSYQIVMVDTGRGIPLGKLYSAFTTLHTSGKDSTAYVASIGVHGVGAKATSGCSKHFHAITQRQDGCGELIIQSGVVKHHYIDRKKKSKETGTFVFFEPDPEIFSGIKEFPTSIGYNMLMDLVEFLSVFIPNIHIRVFKGKALPIKTYDTWKNMLSIPSILATIQPNIIKTVFETQDAMTPDEYVRLKCRLVADDIWNMPPISKPLNMGDPNDTIGYDISLKLNRGFENNPGYVVSSVNMTPISNPQSYQISGLMDVVKEKIAPIIVDESMRSFFTKSYKLPLYGYTMVKFKTAGKQSIFTNQAKHSFENKDFLRLYVISLRSMVAQFPEELWIGLFDMLEDDIERKFRRYMKRELTTSTGLKNINLQLNDARSYIGCRSSDPNEIELFILEGDSAAGNVVASRNSDTQAVFKLKGKPTNGFGPKELMNDLIFQDLVRLIGVTPTDKDLSNMNFKQIVILSDADADGYHIASLMVGNFYQLNPQIVHQGRILVANPPLYIMGMNFKGGINQRLFLKDWCALLNTKITKNYYRFLKIKIVENQSGKEMVLDGEQFRQFCYFIDHIGKIITNVADTLVIQPEILELLVYCVDYLDPLNLDKIKETLDVDKVTHQIHTNTLIITDGGLDITVPLTNLVKEIKSYILPEFGRINWKGVHCKITTKTTNTYNDYPATYYQLYSMFQTLDKLFTIDRMKGLGEMPPEDLEVTCINPDTRSYYRIRSVGDVEKLYGLLGMDTTLRKQLVSV